MNKYPKHQTSKTTGYDMRKKRWHIYRKQHGHCFWCLQPMLFNMATADHLIPRRVGGTEANWNLVLACADCNVKRSIICTENRHRDVEDGVIVTDLDGRQFIAHRPDDIRVIELTIWLKWEYDHLNRFAPFQTFKFELPPFPQKPGMQKLRIPA